MTNSSALILSSRLQPSTARISLSSKPLGAKFRMSARCWQAPAPRMLLLSGSPGARSKTASQTLTCRRCWDVKCSFWFTGLGSPAGVSDFAFLTSLQGMLGLLAGKPPLEHRACGTTVLKLRHAPDLEGLLKYLFPGSTFSFHFSKFRVGVPR